MEISNSISHLPVESPGQVKQPYPSKKNSQKSFSAAVKGGLLKTRYNDQRKSMKKSSIVEAKSKIYKKSSVVKKAKNHNVFSELRDIGDQIKKHTAKLAERTKERVHKISLERDHSEKVREEFRVEKRKKEYDELIKRGEKKKVDVVIKESDVGYRVEHKSVSRVSEEITTNNAAHAELKNQQEVLNDKSLAHTADYQRQSLKQHNKRQKLFEEIMMSSIKVDQEIKSMLDDEKAALRNFLAAREAAYYRGKAMSDITLAAKINMQEEHKAVLQGKRIETGELARAFATAISDGGVKEKVVHEIKIEKVKKVEMVDVPNVLNQTDDPAVSSTQALNNFAYAEVQNTYDTKPGNKVKLSIKQKAQEQIKAMTRNKAGDSKNKIALTTYIPVVRDTIKTYKEFSYVRKAIPKKVAIRPRKITANAYGALAGGSTGSLT